MQVPTKPWYTSKMFWLGIIQVLTGVLEVVTQYLENPEFGLAMLISGILTIIFRWVTKQPVSVDGTTTKYVPPTRV